MIHKYIVIRELDSTRQIKSFLAGMSFADDIAIMGAGFDTFDPFAEYKIEVELLNEDEYFSYGGKISDIIFEVDEIIKLYESRFDSKSDSIEEAV